VEARSLPAKSAEPGVTVNIRTNRALLALVALLALAARPCQGDTIERVDGRKIEGVKVLLARCDMVVYRDPRMAGSPVNLTVKGNQVLSIQRESMTLARLRKVIAEGDYRLAEGILKSVSGKSEWIRAQGMYLLGLAYLSSGNAAGAEKALRAYLREYSARKDFYVPNATLALADALLSAGNADKAQDLYEEMADFGGQWIVRAKLGKAEAILALEGRKGATAAERLFAEVVSNRATPAASRLRAIIGKGKALLARGRSDAAIQWLQGAFFDDPKPADLAFTPERAEASLVLGKASMAKGTMSDLQVAEIWLLRIPALYAKERAALSAAVKLLVDVYEKLGNEERANEWRQYGNAHDIAMAH
jgi:hypothetical protein